MSNWLSQETNSNKLKQTYFMNFIDVSGNCIVRNGSISVSNDGTFGGNLVVTKNATLQSDLTVGGNTGLQSDLTVLGKSTLYGSKNAPVLNVLKAMNIQSDYNFAEFPSGESAASGAVLNTYTNTTDATFSPSPGITISSNGIKYTAQSNGGLLTPAYPTINCSDITTHILVNFDASSKINWNFLEILTSDTSTGVFSFLYKYTFSSLNGITTSSNNQAVPLYGNVYAKSGNPDRDSGGGYIDNLSNNTNFLANTNCWLSVSLNIRTGSSRMYLNGTRIMSFGFGPPPSFKAFIKLSVGYAYTGRSNQDLGINAGSQTIKRVIVDYGNKYDSNMLSVFNAYNSLYVLPVVTVKSDAVDINANLNIQQTLNVTNTTTLNKNLLVIADASFGSNFYVAGNTNINKLLNVTGDASFASTLYVAKNATIDQKLFVTGDASFGSNFYVAGNTNINKLLNVTGDATFNQNISSNTIGVTGKITAGSFGTTGRIDASGAITAASFSTTGGVAASSTIEATGKITAGSFGTSGKLDASDNITSLKTIQALIFQTTNNRCNINDSNGTITATKLVSTNTITATNQISGGSLDIGSTNFSVNTVGQVLAKSFTTGTTPVNNGEINATKLVSTDTISATNKISGGSLDIGLSDAKCTINTTGQVVAKSFTTGTNPVNNGEINATKLVSTDTISAANQISGGSLNIASNKCFVNSAGQVLAKSFTTGAIPVEEGTINASKLVSTNTISAAYQISGGSLDIGSTKCTINTTGQVVAKSFTTGTTPVNNGEINATKLVSTDTISATNQISGGSLDIGSTKCTINTSGQVVAKSFTTGTTAATDGTIVATSFNATSDIRLKTNIQQMSSQWENIKALNPSEYNWIDSSKYDCGFIAQEIYTVYPHLRPTLGNVIINEGDNPVTVDGEPVYYTIDYGKMTPYLCKGLQEVMSETDTLKLEIVELKQQIQSLRELVMNK